MNDLNYYSAMRLIKVKEIVGKRNMDKVVEEERRTAFIIWTPLHLFNAVRYILSRGLIGKCDAFYVCQSAGMESYFNGALNEGIFKNTYFTTFEKLKKNQHIWEITSGLLCPSLYVRHIFGREATDNYYDQLFMSVPTRLNDAIIRSNCCGEVIGYDDGTGSYAGNIYQISLGKKYEATKNIISRKRYSIHKEFLNNTEYTYSRKDGIKQYRLVSRELDDEERRQLRRVFAFGNYEQISTYIYLNQPIGELVMDDSYFNKEKEVLETLHKKLGDEISVRMHPRESDKASYKKFTLMDNTSMWEMICTEKIDNNNTLISFFSTAQFTPKMLYNKEPNLVFLYKLFDNCDSGVVRRIEALIEELRETYIEKERILIPETVDDLDEIIETLKKKKLS